MASDEDESQPRRINLFPVELLDRFCTSLFEGSADPHMADLFAFRLTCRAFAAAGRRYLVPEHYYLRVTPAGLDQLLCIANDEELRQRIRAIYYNLNMHAGRMPTRANALRFVADEPGARRNACSDDVAASEGLINFPMSDCVALKRHFDRPELAMYKKSCVSEQPLTTWHMSEGVAAHGIPVEMLSRALSRLPNLRHFDMSAWDSHGRRYPVFHSRTPGCDVIAEIAMAEALCALALGRMELESLRIDIHQPPGSRRRGNLCTRLRLPRESIEHGIGSSPWRFFVPLVEQEPPFESPVLLPFSPPWLPRPDPLYYETLRCVHLTIRIQHPGGQERKNDENRHILEDVKRFLGRLPNVRELRIIHQPECYTLLWAPEQLTMHQSPERLKFCPLEQVFELPDRSGQQQQHQQPLNGDRGRGSLSLPKLETLELRGFTFGINELVALVRRHLKTLKRLELSTVRVRAGCCRHLLRRLRRLVLQSRGLPLSSSDGGLEILMRGSLQGVAPEEADSELAAAAAAADMSSPARPVDETWMLPQPASAGKTPAQGLIKEGDDPGGDDTDIRDARKVEFHERRLQRLICSYLNGPGLEDDHASSSSSAEVSPLDRTRMRRLFGDLDGVFGYIPLVPEIFTDNLSPAISAWVCPGPWQPGEGEEEYNGWELMRRDTAGRYTIWPDTSLWFV